METGDTERPDKKSFRIKNKILIDAEMFYSEPFNALSASALRTLMRCLQKRKWKKERVGGRKKIVYTNEGFIFPYAEAAFLNIGTTQFWKNMNQLIALGFIDLVYRGGWYQKHERERDYSVYRLSDRWKKYGTPEFERVVKEKKLAPHFRIRYHLEQSKAKITSQKRSGHLRESEVDRPKPDDRRLHMAKLL